MQKLKQTKISKLTHTFPKNGEVFYFPLLVNFMKTTRRAMAKATIKTFVIISLDYFVNLVRPPPRTYSGVYNVYVLGMFCLILCPQSRIFIEDLDYVVSLPSGLGMPSVLHSCLGSS